MSSRGWECGDERVRRVRDGLDSIQEAVVGKVCSIVLCGGNDSGYTREHEGISKVFAVRRKGHKDAFVMKAVELLCSARERRGVCRTKGHGKRGGI